MTVDSKSSGFTLIEVLIALAIIAIALMAIVKASSFNIENMNYVQTKTIANMAANNILAEAQLGLTQPANHQPLTLMHTQLYWSLKEIKTPDAAVKKLIVTIRSKTALSPLITLWGFKHEE